MNAPVLIISCNRPEHFLKTINSLKECEEAKNTSLFVYIDAPPDKTIDNINKNLEVRKIAENIYGFKKVHINISKENIGAFNNFNLGRNELFKNHSYFIFLEDDNIVSKEFLYYMNEGLKYYEDDSNCYSVCGYNYSIPELNKDKINSDVFSYEFFNGWGVGYYRDKYIEPKRAILGWNHLYKNPYKFWKIERQFGGYIMSILRMVSNTKSWGDISYSNYCIKNNMYSIYPVYSKVINIGHDGSGINCMNDSAHSSREFITNKSQDYNFENNNNVNIIIRERLRKKYGARNFFMVVYTYILYIIISNLDIKYAKKVLLPEKILRFIYRKYIK